MATNYQRGAAFERKAQKELEGHGFAVVRSAGSHSPTDLVAMRAGEIVLVQCKLNGYIGPDEWNELYEFAKVAGGVPILASPKKEGRKCAIIYHRLTSRKGGRGRQPLAPWVPRRRREDGNVS